MAKRMKIAFRADASLQMGSGHVMRCLTLADALKDKGADCCFICREHPGNLNEFIRSKGYPVQALPHSAPAGANPFAIKATPESPQLAHAGWLGTTHEHDAAECAAILGELQPDWLIVDHYALDTHWEAVLKPHYRKLLVIDDLADRHHACDLLLDQTFGRHTEDYAPWVPSSCTLLCGSQFALLRPEFSALRPYSLERRRYSQLQHVLITMGGVDKDNATGQVLEALMHTELPADCRITVVMGAHAPWLTEVRQLAEQMPWSTEVRVNVNDMARLMADSDLAIGAAGATSWERCCLGLPTITAVLADNQRQVAQGLKRVRAAHVIQSPRSIPECLPALMARLVLSPSDRILMTQAAARIIDGRGVQSVVQKMEF